MKKEILVAISVAGVLFGLSVSLAAQEKLSLAQCREMALKYNKDMAAANKQTEAARLMSLSYKANFFPNFTANGTGIYSTADGSLCEFRQNSFQYFGWTIRKKSLIIVFSKACLLIDFFLLQISNTIL